MANEKLNIETDSEIKISLSDGDERKTTAKVKKAKMNTNTSAGGTRTHIPISTRTRIPANSQSSFDSLTMIIVLILVAGGGFYAYKNPKVIAQILNMGLKTKAAGVKTETTSNPPESGSADLSATGLVTVTITSEPLGAQIYIDGNSIGSLTPAQAQIPANKDVKLRLEKSGYQLYEASFMAQENGKTFRATLMSGRVGVLNLSLINGGASPEIEINGTKISEPLPLRNYRLPAGIPVIIKVQNSFLGLKAERTVVLGENESKSVELILRPEKNQP